MPNYIGYDPGLESSVTKTVESQTTISGTSVLYLPFDSDVNDDSTQSQSITNSDVSIETSVKKFGSASAYFDGNDHLEIAHDSSIGNDFIQGDFTMEGWIYVTNLSSERTIFSRWDANSNYRQFVLKLNTGGNLIFEFNNNSDMTTSGAGSVSTNEWTHVAVTREGNTIRLFINGTLMRTKTSVAQPQGMTTLINIGRRESGGQARYFMGYMDDIRFVDDQALYTSSFTPQSVAIGGTGNKTTTTTTVVNKITNASVWTLNSGSSSNSRKRKYNFFAMRRRGLFKNLVGGFLKKGGHRYVAKQSKWYKVYLMGGNGTGAGTARGGKTIIRFTQDTVSTPLVLGFGRATGGEGRRGGGNGGHGAYFWDKGSNPSVTAALVIGAVGGGGGGSGVANRPGGTGGGTNGGNPPKGGQRGTSSAGGPGQNQVPGGTGSFLRGGRGGPNPGGPSNEGGGGGGGGFYGGGGGSGAGPHHCGAGGGGSGRANEAPGFSDFWVYGATYGNQATSPSNVFSEYSYPGRNAGVAIGYKSTPGDQPDINYTWVDLSDEISGGSVATVTIDGITGAISVS